MEGGVQTMLQEERGLMQQAEENLHTKGGRKALLAAACCLFTICILGLPTAYLLTRNSDAAKQSASTIQIQNRSLQPSGHQTRGVNHPQKDKPRAHLTVQHGDWQKNTKSNAVQWEDIKGLAFTRSGMTYQKPCLKIPLSGDYFIYTQVTFRHSPPEGHQNSLKHIELRIQKISLSYGKPEDLLSSTESLCAGCSWVQPIYLGGVVTLDEGDLLSVNASDIRVVDKGSEHKTFFGAFLL
ncbi:hypothetical protein NDU88_012077 [Pleurodeles waltl]|uniref:THD domain-containing protein n=1 Tax=Pleurodeles waltl TaxID=8319 RepID=A0AAV7R0G5_PLEWA|nr:hypothetical protein NDU88_012077 [Pleurodeles waltl]